MNSPLVRRFFWFLNRFLMVPAFRLGLGPLVGNPFSGYIMVLKTVGNKTGKVRYAPVNYAILNGNVYCLAGFGQVAHWYRNIRAQPSVELILPGGSVTGIAEDVTDADERLRAFRQVLKNGGFAGFFLGFNPHTGSDEVLREKVRALPVVRIRPTGIGSGAVDPGGWLWVLMLVGFAWRTGRRFGRRELVN